MSYEPPHMTWFDEYKRELLKFFSLSPELAAYLTFAGVIAVSIALIIVGACIFAKMR